MQYKIVKKISGILLFVFLISVQAEASYAFYSPALNGKANIVKQHIQDSKKVNGNGTLDQAFDKVADKNNRGLYNVLTDSVKTIVTDSLRNSFFDGLSLLFGRWYGTNEWISNCLRDDIWQLQALQEQVLSEMFRSAILDDTAHSNQLWKDYKELDAIYSSVKESYRKGTRWFPNEKNLYVDCPYGEFSKAWYDVKKAFDSFKLIGQGNIELGSFSSMQHQSDVRSTVKASEWLRKNQLTLTVGSTEGGNPRNLLSKPGMQSVVADVKTQFSYVQSMAELIFGNTYKGITGLRIDQNKLTDINALAASYQAAYDAKHLAENQFQNAVRFNLSFTDINDNAVKIIDSKLYNISHSIKSASDTKYAQQNFRTFCEKILKAIKIQCGDKTRNIPLTCQ